LSPLFLLLVIEGLSISLQVEKCVGAFKGRRVGRSLRISHLLFINGILILCDDTQMDSQNLRKIMDLYCKATGVMINMGKYIVSFMGVGEEDKMKFLQMFPY
jgi:hypothetical protein